MNSLLPFVMVSACLFSIGFAIVVSKKNLIFMLMGVELMLNAANINLVAFSRFDKNPAQGQVFALFVMIIAATEIAIGLAIILKIRTYYKNINPDELTELKN